MFDVENIVDSIQLSATMLVEQQNALRSLPATAEPRLDALDEIQGQLSTIEQTMTSIIRDIDSEISAIEDELAEDEHDEEDDD